jgi:hypothetical protein
MANWQIAMANSNGEQLWQNSKNVIIRLLIIAIGVCHDNSAKADLQKRSVPSST